MNDMAADEDRRNLEITGSFHLGDLVNVLRSGEHMITPVHISSRHITLSLSLSLSLSPSASLPKQSPLAANSSLMRLCRVFGHANQGHASQRQFHTCKMRLWGPPKCPYNSA